MLPAICLSFRAMHGRRTGSRQHKWLHKSKNVPLLPKKLFSSGKVYVSVKLPTHKANVQVAIATARTRFGKISASSTQVIGPNDIA